MPELPDLFSMVASEMTQGNGLICVREGLGQILGKGSSPKWCLDPGTGKESSLLQCSLISGEHTQIISVTKAAENLF